MLEAGRTYTVYAFVNRLIDGEYVKSMSSNVLTYTLPKQEASLVGKFFAYANDEAGTDFGGIASDGFHHVTGIYFINESEAIHAEFKKVDNNLILVPVYPTNVTYVLENNILNITDVSSGELMFENAQILDNKIDIGGDFVWLYSDYNEIIYSET